MGLKRKGFAMLSYPRAVRALAAVNVAGIINHRLCTRDGWAPSMERGFERHFDRFGPALRTGSATSGSSIALAAILDRARLSSTYALAHTPRMMRHLWSPSFWIMGSARTAGWLQPLQPAVVGACLLSFSWLEVVAGRGHLVNLRPSDLAEPARGGAHIHLDRHLHFGALGYLLEWPCVAAAHICNQRQRPQLAAACLYGAVAGRLLLQPLRLLACAACLVVALPVSVLAGAAVVAADVGLGLVHQASALAARRLGRPEQAPAPSLFNTIASRVLEHRVMDDTLPANSVRATPKGDVSAQVRAFMSVRLQEFARVPDGSEVEAAQVVCEVRDSIVLRLRDYCLDLPDNQGYRWGISQLNSFIATSHDEALCVANP